MNHRVFPASTPPPQRGRSVLTARSIPVAARPRHCVGESLALYEMLTHLYKLVRGVEGMGQGDFKLLAGLGALMGWQVLPSIILLSSMVGALVGVGLIVFRGHGRNVPMPFGPYLAGGGIAAMFFGQQLSRALWPAF